VIDLHSVVLHQVEWTELAITHEINRVLRGNTIAQSTVGKYVREFICGPKEKDSFIVRQFEGDSALDDRIGSGLAVAPFVSLCSIAKRDVEVHCLPSCDERQRVEFEAAPVGPFQASWR
jgi:hypothetical protein